MMPLPSASVKSKIGVFPRKTGQLRLGNCDRFAKPIGPCRHRCERRVLAAMALFDLTRLRTLFRRRDPDRFERFNIVLAILMAGWVPSILMLVVSYTSLTDTLETKILRDRQTFVQLIAHLVGDDLSRTGGIIEYYQTQPEIGRILVGPDSGNGRPTMADSDILFPSADRRNVHREQGRKADCLDSARSLGARHRILVRLLAGRGPDPPVYVSPVHPRLSDNRLAADIVGAVRAPEGSVAGYLGVSVLVERMGTDFSPLSLPTSRIAR